MTLSESAPTQDLRKEIGKIGAQLRQPLLAVLEAVAGSPPRPSRVARAIGLDKSLASRFVRAVMADSDLELMHIVPSPEGLRILVELAGEYADPALIPSILEATEGFQRLLDNTPGGRATIDAHIAEASPMARRRSEHVAMQAAFKSMSFLLGHFCETLSSTLFLVPGANGRMVDGIEIHRRIGLRRTRPNTPLALLSIYDTQEEGKPEESVAFETIYGTEDRRSPEDYLLKQFSSGLTSGLQVARDGTVSTLVLGGDSSVRSPVHITSALRVRNVWPVDPGKRYQSIRGYVLHMPCRRLVRDIFVAEPLYLGASPRVSFILPGPRGRTPVPDETGPRHFAEVDLRATIQQLPPGAQAYSMPGRSDHAAVLQHALGQTGHENTRFVGWRCAITYPVPLVEMMWWLVHPGHQDPTEDDG